MKRAFLLIVVLLGSVSFGTVSGSITQVADLSQIEQAVESLDERSLVLFDVDDVLIVAGDKVLCPIGGPFAIKFIKQILENPDCVPPGKYQEGYLHSKTLEKVKPVLVDQKSPLLIKGLQAKGIKTIALTAAQSGKLGVLPDMAQWRIDQLRKLGIDFTPAFPNQEPIWFPEMGGKESPPLFREGILFTTRRSKGPVLVAFLEKINWYPKKVLFVDDRKNFLESVEAELAKLGIEFIGFHYTAADSFKISNEAEERIGEFQFHHLAEQGEWLNDEEAKAAMKEEG